MIRKKVDFTWEDSNAQEISREWRPFPNQRRMYEDADRVFCPSHPRLSARCGGRGSRLS